MLLTVFCGLCAGIRHRELAQLTVLLSPLLNWFGLGLQLGIHYHELKKIELEEHGSVDRCLASVLQRWMNEEDDVKSSGGATKEALISALKELQENALAEAVDQATLGKYVVSLCALFMDSSCMCVIILLLCLFIGLKMFPLLADKLLAVLLVPFPGKSNIDHYLLHQQLPPDTPSQKAP